jgi:endonuclease YncB( thermonuclease family)
MRQWNFIAALGGIAAWLAVAATPGWAAEATITDGSTLIVDGVTYRLEGIAAPQTDQTCLDDKGAAWTCGVEARDRLREHAGKRAVRCTDRGADSFIHKKRIGECFVEGETTSLNQWMVQQGWALNADRSAKGRFKADRESASAQRLGLWKGCFISPEDLRRFTISTSAMLGAACPPPNNWRVRQTLFPERPAMPAGCDIKGRIGLRSQVAGYLGIYHLPSCRSYARTKQPHRWFCSEQEAQAAGYRKSYTC